MDWLKTAKQRLKSGYALDRRFYFDTNVFELETAYLEKHWVALARVSDFETAYSYKTYNILNHKVIIALDKANQFYSYSAICPHRGAVIADGVGVGKHHRCPYHAWKFSIDGSLIGAPFMEKKDCQGLHRYGCLVWQGWIFVNLSGDADIEMFNTDSVNAELQDYRLSELVPLADKITFEGAFNWKSVIDNFGESYHVIGTHKDSIYDSIDFKRSHWRVTEQFNASNYPSFDAERTFFPQPQFNLKDTAANTCNFQLYPMLLIGLTPDFVIWIELDIVERLYTRAHYHILGLPEIIADEAMSVRLPQLRSSIEHIAGEDIGAYLNVGSSAMSKPYPSGRLSQFEQGTQSWFQWYLNNMLKGAVDV